MASDKPISAGNQQERLSREEKRRWFVAGVVEGEGSVHLSIKVHPSARFRVYVQPEFFVYQHRTRRALLEMAQEVFDAGTIRPKPGNPDVLVLQIASRPALAANVVPFLRQYMEFSSRRADYERFAEAVDLLLGGVHRTREGLVRLVELAYAMNMGGKQRRTRKADLVDRILRGHTPDAPEPERRDGPTSVATRRARRNRNDLATQLELGSNNSA